MAAIVHNALIAGRERTSDGLFSGASIMSGPYKIRVKLGSHEFEAEGPEDVVKEQFALFMDIAKTSATATQPATPIGNNGNGSCIAAGNSTPVTITDDIMSRIFVVDPDGQVSLRILPKTSDRDADSLLILLYGFRQLTDQKDVLVGRLLRAAKTSGIKIERIDRAISPNDEFITKGGARVGARYGLNNRGVTRAEEIIAEMLN